MRLFITAFLQVFFVAGNTVFIAQANYVGVAIFGFAISYLWTLNVKKVTAGTISERILYASGAMFGGLVGMFCSAQLLPYI
jgi:hypothetical protein